MSLDNILGVKLMKFINYLMNYFKLYLLFVIYK